MRRRNGAKTPQPTVDTTVGRGVFRARPMT
jgi:hypothetical protein